MSEKTTKQKSSRTKQPKQDPVQTPVRTAYDEAGLNTEFYPLAVCDNMGTTLFLLDNKPHLPYQKPSLPLYKTDSAFHYLAAHLKTAQTFLLLQTQLLSAILPDTYHSVGIEFACDMAFPELDSIQAFLKWQELHPGQAMCIEGVGLIGESHKVCRFDLTLKHSSGPDYTGIFSRTFFEPLLIAITAYNDIVRAWHKAGFIVVPANFPASIAKARTFEI